MFFGWMNNVNVSNCKSFLKYEMEVNGDFRKKSFKSYGIRDEDLLLVNSIESIDLYHNLNTKYLILFENVTCYIFVQNGMN